MENCKADIRSAHPGRISILGKHLYAHSLTSRSQASRLQSWQSTGSSGGPKTHSFRVVCAQKMESSRHACVGLRACVWRGSGRP